MMNGQTVWIYPHGSPGQAVEARIDLLSNNGRSIALRLRGKPDWCRIDGGLLLHQEDFRAEMLLLREAIDGQPIGPWQEIFRGGQYEIEESEPQ